MKDLQATVQYCIIKHSWMTNIATEYIKKHKMNLPESDRPEATPLSLKLRLRGHTSFIHFGTQKPHLLYLKQRLRGHTHSLKQ